MKIAQDFTQLIGHTPLLRLNNFERHYNLQAELIAKLERFNPAGSSKDRAALYMINDAEKKGLINKDTVIQNKTNDKLYNINDLELGMTVEVIFNEGVMESDPVKGTAKVIKFINE